ncbi:MAG: GTPase [Candidatus Pacearchaeota archaeon]|jgi:hypothetical protein
MIRFRPQGRNTNIEPYWDLVKRIIKESDIVLEVLDARLVELSRNEEVERLIDEIGRPLIFVINKVDLVAKERLKNQVKELSKKGKVVFVSANDTKSIKILLFNIRKTFDKYGKREETVRIKGDPKQRFREAKADIVVGILGYPNVGKSSIINALCHKKKVKVSNRPGTTHGIHWIRASDDIKLIDSPGVIPLQKDDEVRYGLIGAKHSDRLKEPGLVADAVINLFLNHNKEALEELYRIKINDEISTPYEIIEEIARKNSFLLKGGIPDENRAIDRIVKDWQDGKLRV